MYHYFLKSIRKIKKNILHKLSHPDSRSDPIGGSEPVSRCETIYWDSLLFFFLSRTCACGYGLHLITESKYHIHIKRTTIGVVSITIYLFKYPKRRTLVLISNSSYTHTGVPVGTTEFILIQSLYEDTHRYYRD